jgi:hypothetical protein
MRSVMKRAEPLSVLLSFIERGLDDDERAYQPRSLPAALVAALQLTPISIASRRETYFRKLPRGEKPVPLLPSEDLTSVLDNSRRLSRDVSGNKSLAARHLLGALLTHFSVFPSRKGEPPDSLSISLKVARAALTEHLQLFAENESAEKWSAALASLERKYVETEIGGGLKIVRVASEDELCLLHLPQ